MVVINKMDKSKIFIITLILLALTGMFTISYLDKQNEKKIISEYTDKLNKTNIELNRVNEELLGLNVKYNNLVNTTNDLQEDKRDLQLYSLYLNELSMISLYYAEMKTHEYYWETGESTYTESYEESYGYYLTRLDRLENLTKELGNKTIDTTEVNYNEVHERDAVLKIFEEQKEMGSKYISEFIIVKNGNN